MNHRPDPTDSLRRTDAPVTAFRADLAAILAREVGSGAARDVVVLALDGVGYAAANSCWPSARIQLRHAVWPTTTATSWLSQLTGCDPATHGVPGVVIRAPDAPDLVNVFEYPNDDLVPPLGTVFDDARRVGYAPVAVLGDLEPYPGGWRAALLHGARLVSGHPFYTPDTGPYRERPPDVLSAALRDALRAGLDRTTGSPVLVWCYVEIDRHIHRHGYDEHTTAVLERLDRLAGELVDAGAVVLAHADHGLVPTEPDGNLDALLRSVCAEQRCRMGGAGRTRWLYPRPGTGDRVVERLTARLPATVLLEDADDAFGPTASSRARPRVGDLVLTALDAPFIVEPGYRYEHGSRLAGEVETPLASWGL